MHVLIRGEKTMANETATTIDWLRFRTLAAPGEILEGLRPLYGNMGAVLEFGDYGRGLFGFQRSLTVKLGPHMTVGRVDFGGDSQRGWARVDVPGKGCAWVQDWDALDAVESLPGAEIRRLDIALTTWEGQVTHERVVAAHKAGRFTTRGRPPVLQQITSSDPRAGRTCYVGKRDSDKFFRAYEKGFELAAQSGTSAECTHINGFPIEGIYRSELELKSDATPIPWETVERRDQYFSGAYPFCAEVLPGIEPDVLQRRPEKGAQRELLAALANCRNQFGNTLFTALCAYQGDIGAVWEKIVGKAHNDRLLEAGVLMVDHEEAAR
jgi:DNA relaxase NicK